MRFAHSPSALAALLLIALLLVSLIACTAVTVKQADRFAHDEGRMEWWREARFGMFIHWGLYAIPAGEWKGQTNHAEWILTTAQIPVDEYEQFASQFNPVNFDANAWVKLAKEAGAKYIVITSKHHDGFCLFDSKHTDFDVMSTPFRRDILKELADACRREGIRICWYHSIMDWRHPDYLPRRGWEDRPADDADYERYVTHLHKQVRELLTNYGDIGVMWFDGEWEGTWTHEHGLALYDLCRATQPDVIVNNRVDKGRGGMAGMTSDSIYAGDFGTPEQEIPDTGLPGVDWETCMTMNRHWGYNKFDHDFKSTEGLIRRLVDIASKGGNFLLNVGPTAEGEIPPESVERLKAIGAWMRVNGEAIYGTSASPFAHLPWGRCTTKRGADATKLYLHVFDWPAGGQLVLPGVGNEPIRAFPLAQPGLDLAVMRDGADLRITVPLRATDAICSVIVLEIVGEPIIYETPRIEAQSSIFVRPLKVELATASAALVIHYTLDGSGPSDGSPRYTKPIQLSATTTVKAQAFHNGKPVSAVAEATFKEVTPRWGEIVDDLAGGLRCDIFAGDWDAVPDLSAMTPTETRIVPGIGLDPGPSVEYVARRFTGYVTVPHDDVYLFSLTSDDGARLVIGDTLVVDNDGLHGPIEKQGTIALGAGTHPITVEYFNKTGGAVLDVKYAAIGAPLTHISERALRHRRDGD
ncbi:MAG: alpha-L-fucosidase [Phycisphaerales bacterium]|nr:alpha-L-fucosidase [Phycisphaerales bacterium]